MSDADRQDLNLGVPGFSFADLFEPARLGRRINQVHIKNGEKLMRDRDILDWPRLAQEYYDIGYRGWYVLETDSPTKDLIADTRANIEYVRQTFKMPV